MPPQVLYASEFAEAAAYIAQLEKYKKDHQGYPDEDEQTIVPTAARPFGYPGGGARYTLYFNIGFDEYYSYDSTTRQWSFEN